MRTAEAARARRSRDIDVVARFGGEEFVVLLPGADAEEAQGFAERVRAAIAVADDEQPALGARQRRHPLGTRGPASVEELLNGADSALYAAKHAGRDRAVVFEREMNRGGEMMLTRR